MDVNQMKNDINEYLEKKINRVIATQDNNEKQRKLIKNLTTICKLRK